MKKIIYLLLTFIAFSICYSCSSTEDVDLTTDTPITSYRDIQGTWFMRRNAYDFTFTYTGHNYHMTVINHSFGQFQNEVHYTDVIEEEEGTFTVENNIITLTPTEGTTKYSPLEAFWDSPEHRYIIFLPLGAFVRQ